MADARALADILDRLDGRGYKSYGEIRGRFEFQRFSLFIDRVQADPFASPSKLRLRVPMHEAGLPEALRKNPIRRLALADFLARSFRDAIFAGRKSPTRESAGQTSRSRSRSGSGSGKSGKIFIDAGGQEVLERTAIKLTPDWVEARIEVGLPAAGRRILGREAQRLLVEELPQLVEAGLLVEHLAPGPMQAFVECVENQEAIREQLEGSGWLGFVADGAILPRATGASDVPMAESEAVRFHSPESLAQEVDVPNPVGQEGRRRLRGMAIRHGITLIVGGGYHGKSTLLRALEASVYPHIPGDGREYVVTACDGVKIRAEDGRSVSGVDIHAFIDSLPGKNDPNQTRSFSSSDASGSTSQAANIVEALEIGSRTLLLDEDTSATNFMVRDARMQQLVAREHEPITPFVDRIRELHDRLDVSSVLVMGGCGDYFGVADTVVMMRDYEALDVTREAHQIAEEASSGRAQEARAALEAPAARSPLADHFVASRGRRDENVSARGRELILYGEESLDLRYLAQLADASQTRAIARAMRLASLHLMGGERMGLRDSAPSLSQVLDALDAILDEEGLEALDRAEPGTRSERHPGNLARPRRQEIGAAINRMRSLKTRPAR